MSDLMNEERNEKIRKQWLEQIELNERAFVNQLKKENLPFEKFLELEKVQKEGKELKKRIEDGYIPDEPPIRGYKFVDGKIAPMTEEEKDEMDKAMEGIEGWDITTDLEEFDGLNTATQDLNDEGKSQPKPEIQKQEEGGIKLMSRICKLFSRK